MNPGLGSEHLLRPPITTPSLGFALTFLSLLLLPRVIMLKLLGIKPQFAEAPRGSSSASHNHDCAAISNEAHWNRGNKRGLEVSVHLPISPGRTTISSIRT